MEGGGWLWLLLDVLGVVILAAYQEFERRVGVATTARGAKREMVLDAVKRLASPFQYSDLVRACPGVSQPTIDRVLAPGGLACVQTILVPDRRWARYRRTPDWIERYVFPGCLIPSLGALGRAMKGTRLEVYGLDEIGPHYAETLRRWRARFHERIADVRSLGYDERFERTWDFYLAFCEAAFRQRALRDVQLLLARSGSA